MEYYPIENYEGIYEINKNGDVIRVMKSGALKPVKMRRTHHGQKTLTLCKKGEKKKFITLMRLVFNTFAPENIRNSGKLYDLILTNGKKSDCSFDNIEWYEREKPYLSDYDNLSKCEKFAHDTKYITYVKDVDGREFYVFKRIIGLEQYKEMWNIDRIEENLDYLQSKYKEWLAFLPAT